jgi:5-methylcytosine-specific restriction endonuclease McrA
MVMPSGIYIRTEMHRAICRKARAVSSGAKGKKWSAASRKARSEKYRGVRFNTGRTHFKKGFTPWNKGLTGVVDSWNKDKLGWMTKEHLEALKKANRGRIPWNKGKKIPAMSGQNNPAWRGGITKKNQMERVKFRKQIQPKVFARDNYTCQICEEYGVSLQVDHIKSWKDYPELRFELDNCRTLCMACHYYITFKRKMPAGIVWGHNFKQRMK